MQKEYNIKSVDLSSKNYEITLGLLNRNLKEIPKELTKLVPYMFYNNTSLETAVLPEGITTLYSYLFYNCANLKSIDIPDTVTQIGSYTFYSCDSLTSVVIPNSVTDIGARAFAWCEGLKSINIPVKSSTGIIGILNNCKNLEELTLVDMTYLGGVFGAVDYSYNADYVPSSLKKVTLLDMKWLSKGAFQYCPVETVILPDTLTEIYDFAFRSCTGLKSLVLPESLTSIGARVFEMCYSLTNIRIPDSVTQIGAVAFYDNRLENITVGENNTVYKDIDGNLYSKDGTLLIQYALGKPATTFTIPDSVTTIGQSAFAWNRNLTEIILPASLNLIEGNAFFFTNILTSVIFKGTKAQWALIENNGLYSGRTGVGATYVQCLDGNVEI